MSKMMKKSIIIKKLLVNIIAIITYILLEKFFLKNQFSFWSIITPIVLLLPVTLLVKFDDKA